MHNYCIDQCSEDFNCYDAFANPVVPDSTDSSSDCDPMEDTNVIVTMVFVSLISCIVGLVVMYYGVHWYYNTYYPTYLPKSKYEHYERLYTNHAAKNNNTVGYDNVEENTVPQDKITPFISNNDNSSRV